MDQRTRSWVFWILIAGIVLTVGAAYLECAGVYSSAKLSDAGYVGLCATFALGLASLITISSTMRIMAIWPGMCFGFTWIASILIFIVSSTKHYHNLAAELSLFSLAVAALLQFVYVVVWRAYVKSEPDTVTSVDWTLGHP